MNQLAEARPRRQLIIDRPELVPVRHRVAWGVLTAVFWIAWAYLWSPVITLAAWGLGLYLGYRNLAPDIFSGELWPIVLSYVAVVVVIGIVLLGWAQIEFLRFRSAARRRAPVPVTPGDLAALDTTQVGLSVAQIEAWQHERRLEVSHDDAGRIVGATVLDATPALTATAVMHAAPIGST